MSRLAVKCGAVELRPAKILIVVNPFLREYSILSFEIPYKAERFGHTQVHTIRPNIVFNISRSTMVNML